MTQPTGSPAPADAETLRVAPCSTEAALVAWSPDLVVGFDRQLRVVSVNAAA